MKARLRHPLPALSGGTREKVHHAGAERRVVDDTPIATIEGAQVATWSCAPSLDCGEHMSIITRLDQKGASLLDRDWKNSVGISLQVIGRIRTSFVEATGTPIQPVYAQGAEGQVIVDDPFAAALDDIEGFDRVWLVYWMDRVAAFQLRVVPYRDTRERGLFATRSPCRPNPIGMSAVRLVRREGCCLHVLDADVLDDTPLLDIKPYMPEFDAHPSARAGWFDACEVDRKLADGRFHEPADFGCGRRR